MLKLRHPAFHGEYRLGSDEYFKEPTVIRIEKSQSFKKSIMVIYCLAGLRTLANELTTVLSCLLIAIGLFLIRPMTIDTFIDL